MLRAETGPPSFPTADHQFRSREFSLTATRKWVLPSVNPNKLRNRLSHDTARAAQWVDGSALTVLHLEPGITGETSHPPGSEMDQILVLVGLGPRGVVGSFIVAVRSPSRV